MKRTRFFRKAKLRSSKEKARFMIENWECHSFLRQTN
jgi:hypothetical protein